jgi:serine/threonine-protein kinase CLA4
MPSYYSANQFMNPGPAPRPPVDRPRLDLQRSQSAVPVTTFDTMSLGPPSPAVATPNGGYFPNASTLSLNTQKNNGPVTIIKEGWVRCKEDKFLAGWNDRYLILREFRLDFLKNENGKVISNISLKDVTGVSRSETTRMAFEITRLANPTQSKAPILNRDLPTKTVTCEVRNDDEIYEWIDKIYERCPGMGGVSNPTNFSHRIHVGFDPQTGGFVGLPQEWEKLLTASAITKEDYKKNPQAVIEVLEFVTKQQPDAYQSPFPQASAMQPGKSLHGYSGSSGNGVAPPRPAPPSDSQRYNTNQFVNKYQDNITRTGTPPAKPGLTRSATDKSGYDMEADAARIKEIANQEQQRIKREREMQRQQEDDRQRREQDRAREADRVRREQDDYNAQIPKSRPPMAQQEIGGGGYVQRDKSAQDPRYDPGRAAPRAPPAVNGNQQQMRQPPTAQRQAPSAPNKPPSQIPKATNSPSQGSLRTDSRHQSPGSRYQQDQNRPRQDSASRPNQNGAVNGKSPPPVQQVKPLNVAKQPPQQGSKPAADPRKEAEAALTAKKPDNERAKEVRMSSMTESEVMAKLKQVVSRDNPMDNYSKQKKIGQGASGSVYVARVKESATSQVAREIYRTHGPKGQVAIKQMDLRNQPRKELIVNEIIVMKDSKHPNIVNFLDSFLQEASNELWVVMEFMEGGALTDVIDNNPVITEEQIATICNETCKGLAHLHSQDIIHRDIKSDNVLLDRMGNVKISKSNHLPSQQQQGNVQWMHAY